MDVKWKSANALAGIFPISGRGRQSKAGECTDAERMKAVSEANKAEQSGRLLLRGVSLFRCGQLRRCDYMTIGMPFKQRTQHCIIRLA